jgi:2-polyprenyl-3-methyl-5-hydroxy-6-metoxy-1,4-benzoquinol methylase
MIDDVGFDLEDMDTIYDAYMHQTSDWNKLVHTHMRLPEWYDHTLEPLSVEYANQQHKLWKAIVNLDREYDPELDEQTHGCVHTDVVRFPGGFIDRGNHAIAIQGEHNIATGMFLKYSNLRPGQWALEYGAGFGGTALQMARLGANVDTVDVSEYFCDAIRQQAEFYGVPLTPFKGRFGDNPRGDKKYDLIFFYESFHHSVDFVDVVAALKRNLASDGRIMLAGEPIVTQPNAAIPYDWGIRLSAENLAIMRYRKWFELGFTEGFITRIFNDAGFHVSRMHCDVSTYGEGYIITHQHT